MQQFEPQQQARRDINTDPREQQTYREYEQPGAMGGAEKIYPGQRPRPTGRHGFPWLLIVIALIVALAIGGLLNRGSFNWGSQNLRPQSFNVAPNTTLIIDGNSSDVHVHKGSGNTIVVQGQKYAYGLGADLNTLDAHYSQNGDTITVDTSDNAWSIFGSEGINLDITVPDNLNLTVREGSGDVAIQGVNDNVNIQSSSGDVNLQDIDNNVSVHTSSGDIKANALNGQVNLATSSGDISLNSISGQATLETSSGDIKLDHAQLRGQSSVKTQSGDINFSGTLDPNGSYQMSTSSGDISLSLPENSSFQLNTSTDSGDVNNDFGSTTVGNSPRASLSLNTSSGDINIHKQ